MPFYAFTMFHLAFALALEFWRIFKHWSDFVVTWRAVTSQDRNLQYFWTLLQHLPNKCHIHGEKSIENLFSISASFRGTAKIVEGQIRGKFGNKEALKIKHVRNRSSTYPNLVAKRVRFYVNWKNLEEGTVSTPPERSLSVTLGKGWLDALFPLSRVLNGRWHTFTRYCVSMRRQVAILPQYTVSGGCKK